MSRKRCIIIGLTGPTGAGKSSVGEMLAELGCAVIDADRLAREAVKKGTMCLKQLQLAFGDGILDENGELNRRELAKIAFSSEENTRLLNGITHPHILMLTMIKIKQLAQNGFDTVVFDAPTLFESNCDVMCDYIITVTANSDIRLKRIMQRDAITYEQAQSRMKSQKSDDFFKENSDYTVYNNDDLNETEEEIKRIICEIKSSRNIE